MRLFPETQQEEFALGMFVHSSTHGLVEGVDVKQLILKHLAPGLGAIVAFIMFFSPFFAIQQVRKQKHLGDLNPLPLVAIIANCLVWLVYGSITQDIYVIMANQPGLLLGVYMTMTAYGFADAKLRDMMLKAILFFATVISITSWCISLFVSDQTDRATAAGYQAVGVLLIYYAAPLSALAEVLKSRSSAALYWPLSVMSCVNGSLWVTYGAAIQDPFIWGPNAVGVFFGVVQLVLIMILPNKPSTNTNRANALEQDSLRAPLDPHGEVHGGGSNVHSAA